MELRKVKKRVSVMERHREMHGGVRRRENMPGYVHEGPNLFPAQECQWNYDTQSSENRK